MELTPDDIDIFFIEDNKVYTRSTASLKVCRYLGALWPLCYGLIIIPKFIRKWHLQLGGPKTVTNGLAKRNLHDSHAGGEGPLYRIIQLI